MKKFYRINIVLLPVILIALLVSFSAFDVNETGNKNNRGIDSKHKNTALELVKNNKGGRDFPRTNLFTKSVPLNAKNLNAFVKNAVSLKIERSSLVSLNSLKPDVMTLVLPAADNSSMEIELVKTNFLPADFKVFAVGKNGTVQQPYNPGTYYTGIIKGDETSIATFSVFEGNVMGIFSTSNGNYVLGSVKDNEKKLTDNYVLYNDIDVVNKPGFECGSGDSYDKYYLDPPVKRTNSQNNTDFTTSPVDIDFTCDYQMYLDGNSNTTTVINFVTGAFAHVRTLYLNEGLTVNMSSSTFVYTSSDPYANLSTSTAILEEFGYQTQNSIDGDLAHLLSTGHGQSLGGIAWINALCQSYEPTSGYGRYAFSNIEGSYQPYPTFSWTVMVITHETGHNYGSMHTHACTWPTLGGGGLGSIDSCYTAEGTCFQQTVLNNNGTIMSYCHLNGAINLTLGFGPLPHDTIVERYNNALCLDNPLNSSEIPLAYKLLQNYPNPFNPVTVIKFALPQDGLVTLRIYDATGREVAKLINSQYYSVGIFSYNLDASRYNLASGVYFYKMDVSSNNNNVYSEIKKMVLVK